MELKHEFRVSVPVEDAWAVLTDVERIAPCMPGADLQEVQGEEYRGVVKVKVGPITTQYKGAATWVERDDAGHRAVLRAEGRETRGQGNASATITATLAEDVGGTQVTIETDLTVSGRVAQFGRGVLADVSAKLLDQFVDCLEADVLKRETPPPQGDWAEAEESAVGPPTNVHGAPQPRPGASGQGPTQAGDGGGVRRIDSGHVQPVDLMSTAGAPIAKRAAPLVALLFLVVWLLRRRRRH